VKIVDVRVTPVYVPMHHPLRWSFGVEPGMTRTIVELVTDEGLVGLGESNGGAELAAAVLESRPLYVGLDPLEVSRIAKRFAICGTATMSTSTKESLPRFRLFSPRMVNLILPISAKLKVPMN